jgi:hypothetical protein
MARTISDREYDDVVAYMQKKRTELTDRQKIIDYFNQIGYCDKSGNTVYPYANSSKQGNK